MCTFKKKKKRQKKIASSLVNNWADLGEKGPHSGVANRTKRQIMKKAAGEE